MSYNYSYKSYPPTDAISSETNFFRGQPSLMSENISQDNYEIVVGVMHIADIYYIFYNGLDAATMERIPGIGFFRQFFVPSPVSSTDSRVGDFIQTLWTNFAKYGYFIEVLMRVKCSPPEEKYRTKNRRVPSQECL